MPKINFGKVTAYQTLPFYMAFVFSIVVFLIDHYCAGGGGGGGRGTGGS